MVLSVVITTSVLTYISINAIISDKKAYIYDFIYSNTEVTSVIFDQYIKESLESVESVIQEIEKIQSDEDAELYIEPVFRNSSDLFEFTLMRIDNNGELKREFTRYSYHHFQKLSENYHLLLKNDSNYFDSHILNTKEGEKSVDVLFSKEAAPRLVLTIRPEETKDIYVFKFSLQNILEQAFLSESFEYALAKENGEVVISSRSEIITGNIKSFLGEEEQRNANAKQLSSTVVKEHLQVIEGVETEIILGIRKIKGIKTFLTTGITSSKAFRVTNIIVTKVILTFLMILSFCSLIAFLLVKALTRPLNNLVEATNVVASGNFDHRINVHSGDELQALSLSFNSMIEKVNEFNEKLVEANLFLEEKVKARTAELQGANDFINAVLESIDQGLFIFNKKGIVLDVNNRRFRDIWGYDPTDKHLETLFDNLDSETMNMWLRNLFEERLDFESLIKLGPTTKEFPDREELSHLNIEYFPMRNKKGRIENVIGIASDITEKVAFENELQEKSAKVQSILSISTRREEYQAYIIETINSFDKLKILFNQANADPIQIAPEVLRHFHSIKGNSSVFSLSEVSHMAHICEDFVQKKMMEKQPFELRLLESSARDVEDAFYTSLKQYQNISGLNLANIGERTVELKLSTLKSFLNIIKSFGDENLTNKYSDLFLRRPSEEFFQKFIETVHEISNKLHRKVENIQVIGKDIRLHKFYYQKFFNELIHVFRNIADHANEQPHKRVASGKKDGITITISIAVINNDGKKILKLEILDDGKGIDPNIVRSRLKANGADEFVLGKNDADIIQHIFDPAFSTAEKVTELSGRGVGLAAIKSVINEIGGRFRVVSQVGKGTKFTFLLPYA